MPYWTLCCQRCFAAAQHDTFEQAKGTYVACSVAPRSGERQAHRLAILPPCHATQATPRPVGPLPMPPARSRHQPTHRRGGRPPTVVGAGHRRGGRPPSWGQATVVGAGHRRGGRPPSWGQATVVGAGHPQGVALLYANHTGHAVVQRITLNKTRQIVILMLCLVDTDVICLAKSLSENPLLALDSSGFREVFG
jgi:hypothetical protein